ncbi:MAG: DUF805 domain-containing protein [Proteobacteria bacterium]|nr:DUF805 domain-containing protein [Pseudomonadota bacterium]
MDFGTAIATCFRKYVTIKGRASRSEYWWFALFGLLLQLCTTILDRALMGTEEGAGKPFTAIQGIVLFLPSLAVMVRRFHDINFSGWVPLGMAVFGILLAVAATAFDLGLNLLFFSLLTLLLIVYIYFLCTSGDRGDNRFGPDPLGHFAPATPQSGAQETSAPTEPPAPAN